MPRKTKIKKQCAYCNSQFETLDNRKKYCSLNCASIGGHKIKADNALKKWLDTGKLDYSPNTMIKVNSIYRKYIDEEQNGKCSICGMKQIWNGKPIVFILDHIDGDSSNHDRKNLRLICPNCDSQLDTYKAKNKNSKRTRKC